MLITVCMVLMIGKCSIWINLKKFANDFLLPQIIIIVYNDMKMMNYCF